MTSTWDDETNAGQRFGFGAKWRGFLTGLRLPAVAQPRHQHFPPPISTSTNRLDGKRPLAKRQCTTPGSTFSVCTPLALAVFLRGRNPVARHAPSDPPREMTFRHDVACLGHSLTDGGYHFISQSNGRYVEGEACFVPQRQGAKLVFVEERNRHETLGVFQGATA